MMTVVLCGSHEQNKQTGERQKVCCLLETPVLISVYADVITLCAEAKLCTVSVHKIWVVGAGGGWGGGGGEVNQADNY